MFQSNFKNLHCTNIKEAEVSLKVKHGKICSNQALQGEWEKLEKKVNYHHTINWIRLTWDKGKWKGEEAAAAL